MLYNNKKKIVTTLQGTLNLAVMFIGSQAKTCAATYSS
jgi:hypothetical protein